MSPEPGPLENLLVQARDLAGLDAPRAEIWVSGLLAEVGDDVPAFLDLLERSDTLEADLVAHVLAAISTGDTAARAKAIAAAGTERMPSWVATLGTGAAVDATRVCSGGRLVSLILRFEHRGGERHLMLLDIVDGAAVDVRFAPDAELELVAEDDEFDFTPASTTEMLELAAGALEAADRAEPAVALNLAVAWHRVGAPLASVGSNGDGVDVAGAERDPEADAAALGVLRAALGPWLADPLPGEAVEKVAGGLRTQMAAGEPDVLAVAAAAGIDGTEADEEFVCRFVAAFAAPVRLLGFEPAEAEAILGLEWADWFGAVAGTVRSGAGTEVTPRGLVTAINRCPEITTTIPKSDADYVAWSFELTLHAWALADVIDGRGHLTEFGARVLARALDITWG